MRHSCIITGATGYIGSHLVKYLLQHGWEVHIIAQPEFGYANIENVKDKIHIFEYNHDINSLIEYFKRIDVDAHLFRTVTLRLFDVYGEDDRRPKLPNLLKEIAGTDKSIDVSPGEQYLDMVHISDVCSAYLKAYEYLVSNSDISNEIYGVYTGKRFTLKQIVAEFEKVMDKKITVNWGGKPYKKREVMNPATVYSQLPNWCPSVKLPNGLVLFNELEGAICKYSYYNLNLVA